MSDFKFRKKMIDKIIKDSGCKEVAMTGVHKDLEKLKPVIENIYDEYIFYLSYWKSECGWHGWSWSQDDGTMENMAKITDGIKDKFSEIYALILAGLGEECEED